MNRKAPAVLALGAVLFLGACSQPENEIVPSSPASAAPASEEPSGPVSTPGPSAQRLSAVYGESIVFPSGLSVSVAPPTLIPASPSAAGAIEGQIAVFDITANNGGKEAVNGGIMSSPKITYGASGTQAQGAYDIAAGLGGTSFSTLLPGETQTIRVGVGIPPTELGTARIEIMAPDFMSKPAIFKNS